MSAQRDYNWNRNFSPLFRGMYSDQHLRVSDAERQATSDRLAEHYAAGRLDQAEFDDRVGQAMGAKTRADLGHLFDDLPETGAPAVTDHPRYQGRRRHPVLLFVLLVLFIMATAHAVLWATLPWLWVAFLGAALLFVSGTAGRHRPHQDHKDI